MHREFRVSEIPLDEFNSHYIAHELGSPRTQTSSRGDLVKDKRFFRMLNRVAYNSLVGLLDQLCDDLQKPEAVWYTGQMPVSEASYQTRKNYDEHRSRIIEEEASYNRLTVRLKRKAGKKRQRRGRYNQDMFIFDKMMDGLWIIRHFHIRDPNFGFYNFEGIQGDLDPREVHAACGIYIELKNKKLEEALSKHTPEELKVVRLTLKSGEECYVVPKADYEARYDGQGLPLIFDSAKQGDDGMVKIGIENMVAYVRQEGIPISVDEETWEALKNPTPTIFIARHLK